MTDSSSAAATLTRPDQRTTLETERPWLWKVIVHDSDEHSYEYVIEMAERVFAMPVERGFQLARAIDTAGHGVAMTTHRELAELKAEQVRSFGPDRRMASCRTSMRVTLEPAEG